MLILDRKRLEITRHYTQVLEFEDLFKRHVMASPVDRLVMTCPLKRSPVIMLVWKDKKGEQMVRRNFTAEQIINKLREAEIHINQGISISEASRKIGVTQQTYYRWRKEYGGLRIEQAKRLKSLEKENTRLKKLVADLSLDNAILKEVVGGNF
jgi:transposase-like protein